MPAAASAPDAVLEQSRLDEVACDWLRAARLSQLFLEWQAPAGPARVSLGLVKTHVAHGLFGDSARKPPRVMSAVVVSLLQ